MNITAPKAFGFVILCLVIAHAISPKEPTQAKREYKHPNWNPELIRRARNSTTCEENMALRDLGYTQKLQPHCMNKELIQEAVAGTALSTDR